MPRAKEAIPMLKLYIKIFAFTGILLLVLQGCMTTPLTEGDAQGVQVTAPPEVQAEFTRAVEMLKSGQRGVALQLFQHLAQRYPQLAGVRVNIGIIQLQNNKTKDAIATLKRAIQINPANVSAHHHLGIAYRQAGQFSEAKDSYLQALKLSPDYANAHLNLGILYDIYLQQLDEALEHYKQFQRLSGTEDKQVSKWVIDLERRTAANKPKSQGGS